MVQQFPRGAAEERQPRQPDLAPTGRTGTVKTTVNGGEPKRAPWLPPRWFIRSFWALQRAAYTVTGGRFGLRTATTDHQGMMRLRTVGRRTGEERTAILGYFEDGPNLVTMAMNGWADPEPAWWLNLQANPDTSVDLPDGSRAVHGRAADDDERPRLWARWALYDKDLDAFAARRSRETQVVILEPLTAPQSGRSRSSFAEVRVSRDPQKQSHSRQAIRIDSKRRRT
jgi:deazaflavin-dependent oxidoreductase (nitroreductase family)